MKISLILTYVSGFFYQSIKSYIITKTMDEEGYMNYFKLEEGCWYRCELCKGAWFKNDRRDLCEQHILLLHKITKPRPNLPVEVTEEDEIESTAVISHNRTTHDSTEVDVIQPRALKRPNETIL